MADNTKIEWTEATWNPVTGCSIASPGCTNCYAMKLAGTRLANHPSRTGLTRDSKTGPVWTGAVRFNEQWLAQPLKWKRPRMIFVCAHADLFHESVEQRWLLRIFAVMIVADWHTYQVLTKRSSRMRQFMQWVCETEEGSAALCEAVEELKADADLDFELPPKHVWLGASVEDQARRARLDDLRDTPAAIRWVSAEPLLESLGGFDLTGIDWVVVGGESGPNARAMHPDWARDLRDQCQAANVPFFFKQWGLRFPVGQTRADGTVQEETVQGGFANLHKSFAGRLLDGQLHDGFPVSRS